MDKGQGKRQYVPLPSANSRRVILENAMAKSSVASSGMTEEEIEQIVIATHGYSGRFMIVTMFTNALAELRQEVIKAIKNNKKIGV